MEILYFCPRVLRVLFLPYFTFSLLPFAAVVVSLALRENTSRLAPASGPGGWTTGRHCILWPVNFKRKECK